MRLLRYVAEPQSIALGIIVTAAVLVMMPVLARLKLRAARELNSRAFRTDALRHHHMRRALSDDACRPGYKLCSRVDLGGSACRAPACAMIAREGFEAIGLRGADDNQDY
jgi:hypothetical protein